MRDNERKLEIIEGEINKDTKQVIIIQGGRYASRGFYLQALISVLESVKDNKWISIQIEPEQEKIDILIEFKDKSTKAIQVKSTKNIFTETLIKQTLEELINANGEVSHYEIVLIGKVSENAKKVINEIDFSKDLNLDKGIDISNKIISIITKQLDLEILTSEVKHHLNNYLSYLGFDVKPFALKILKDSLVGENLLYSTNGKKLRREDFEDNLVAFANLLAKYPQEFNEDDSMDNGIREDAKREYRRIKLIRITALILTIFLLINPVVKFFKSNLTILDILGISVFIGVIIGIICLFKISDNKFRKLLIEDLEAYKKNTGNVENEICKISIIDSINYKHNRREVHSNITFYNLTSNNIEYVEGEVQFYYGNRRLYHIPFSEKDISGYESVILYDNDLVPNKARYDWSYFKVKITKLISQGRIKKDMVLYSKSTYKTYRTLLNCNYLPVIYELFGYESSWAIEVIIDQYVKLRHYVKYINIERLFILLCYVLVCLIILAFCIIGIYNFLYIPIELIFN